MGELLATISSRELTEWVAYEAEHGPIGVRPDWGPSLLASLFVNSKRDPKRHPQPIKQEIFMLGGAPQPEQTPEQMEAIAAMAAVGDRAMDEQRRRIAEAMKDDPQPEPEPEAPPPTED